MPQPIGISFLPSQENADQGPQRGAAEGDLGQAMKILSLQLPRVLGAHAITPGSNIGAPGAAGVPTGSTGLSASNPNAALFQALIKALLNGGQGGDAFGALGAGAGAPSSLAAGPNLKFLGDYQRGQDTADVFNPPRPSVPLAVQPEQPIASPGWSDGTNATGRFDNPPSSLGKSLAAPPMTVASKKKGLY